MRFLSLLLFSMIVLTFGCKTSKKINTNNSPIQKNKQTRLLQQQLVESKVFQNGFTGFALYDPSKKEMLFSQFADKYFTPASNTKILTFYTALNILGDSIPALRYVIQNDSLIFWGTGDPSFMHPDLPASTQVLEFLKSRKEKLFFSGQNFYDQGFGAGWAWDDYSYKFSAEKSPFPIHGNYVAFQYRGGGRRFEVKPAFFKYHLAHNPNIKTRKVVRQPHSNTFEFNKKKFGSSYFKSTIPMHYTDELLVDLLGSLIGKKVYLYRDAMLPPEDAPTIHSIPSKDLYQRMMQESDNLIAEQLLLLCGNEVNDSLSIRRTIAYAKQEIFKEAPDKLNWRDGSGLSRYNLLTPRTLIYVLDQLYQKLPRKDLFEIFPSGGVSGTIKHWYKGEVPYVYAKTGTLSNNHCLSGYLISKSKKVLIFSFMHNNYVSSSKIYKEEMTKVLESIRDTY